MQKDASYAKMCEMETACSQNDITWTGYYMDKAKKVNIQFDNFLIKFDGTIEGHGEDGNGKFTIQGEIDVFTDQSHSPVNFSKSYTGEIALTYTGLLSDGTIRGQYSYKEIASGEFEIKANSTDWKGWEFNAENSKVDSIWSFVLDTDFIFGVGTDLEKGNYLLKGLYNTETDVIRFLVMFFGGEMIEYNGKTSRINPNKKKSVITINGNWDFLGSQATSSGSREFELKGRYGTLMASTPARTSGMTTPPKTPAHEPKDRKVPVPPRPDSIPPTPPVQKTPTKEKPAKTAPDIDDLGEIMYEKSIQWTGHSTVSSDPEKKISMTWEDFQVRPDLGLTGSGEDLVGDFILNGEIKINNSGVCTFNFTKEYDEPDPNQSNAFGQSQVNSGSQVEGLDSVVSYQGVIGESGVLAGKWKITEGKSKGYSGSFEMKGSSQDWYGWWMVGGKKVDLLLNLIVEEDFVYGVSVDKVGLYLVQGRNDASMMKVEFIKKYLRSGDVQRFQGDVKRINPNKKKSIVTITGIYGLNKDDCTDGAYELKGKYGQLGKDPGSPTKLKKKNTYKPEYLQESIVVENIVPVPAHKNKVEWAGRYEQSGKWWPMKFADMQHDKAGNIIGLGSDDAGPFTIAGKLDNNTKHVNFDKTYEGYEEGIDGEVWNYDGDLDAKGDVTGTYDCEGITGRFELKSKMKYGLFSSALPRLIAKAGGAEDRLMF
jgi:hypothetical protein